MRRPARNSRGSSSWDIQRGSYVQLGGELSQAGERFGETAHLQCLVLGLEGRVPLDLGVLRVVMLLHANHVGLLRLANFALPWDGAPPSVPARQVHRAKLGTYRDASLRLRGVPVLFTIFSTSGSTSGMLGRRVLRCSLRGGMLLCLPLTSLQELPAHQTQIAPLIETQLRNAPLT